MFYKKIEFTDEYGKEGEYYVFCCYDNCSDCIHISDIPFGSIFMKNLHLREELDCLGGTCGSKLGHSACQEFNEMIRTCKSLHEQGLYPEKTINLNKLEPISKEEQKRIFEKYFK